MLITTKVVSSIPTQDDPYSVQHYVIKLDSDLRQVSGFLRIIWFPPPRNNWNIIEIGVKHQTLNNLILTIVYWYVLIVCEVNLTVFYYSNKTIGNNKQKYFRSVWKRWHERQHLLIHKYDVLRVCYKFPTVKVNKTWRE